MPQVNPNLPPLALVTGASAGIGRCYALELARRGYQLIICARREERLEALAREIALFPEAKPVRVISCDLAQPSARERLVGEIMEHYTQLELLVNNAGFGSLGMFASAELAWECRMVEVNCLAPLFLIHRLLPLLQRSAEGVVSGAPAPAVINVASTAALQPMPYMATYGASKAFLLSLSLALDAELRQKNVRVLAQCPGPTDSDFHQVVGLPEKLSFLPAASAEGIVNQTLDLLQRRERALGWANPLVNGRLNAVLAQLNRLLPWAWRARLVERVLRQVARSAREKNAAKV